MLGKLGSLGSPFVSSESAVVIDKCLHETKGSCSCLQKLDECFSGEIDIVIGLPILDSFIDSQEAIDRETLVLSRIRLVYCITYKICTTDSLSLEHFDGEASKLSIS